MTTQLSTGFDFSQAFGLIDEGKSPATSITNSLQEVPFNQSRLSGAIGYEADLYELSNWERTAHLEPELTTELDFFPPSLSLGHRLPQLEDAAKVTSKAATSNQDSLIGKEAETTLVQPPAEIVGLTNTAIASNDVILNSAAVNSNSSGTSFSSSDNVILNDTAVSSTLSGTSVNTPNDFILNSDSLQPDLSGLYFNVIQEPLDAGDSFDVNFLIRNTGLLNSGAFDVHFYLSTNNYISTADHELGSYTVNTLAADSHSGLLKTNLTLPEQGDAFWKGRSDRQYTIGMYIDPANVVSESDEGNNRNIGKSSDSDSLKIYTNKAFKSFSLLDASGDDTSNTVFDDGALHLNYNWGSVDSLAHVRLEALQAESVVSTLGIWAGASLTDELINLADVTSLTAGAYDFRLVAQDTSGDTFFSASQSVNVLPWPRTNGTFAANTFDYTAASDTGSVFLGRGGTDTLNLLGVSTKDVTSINGSSLATFSGSTANQALFGGTAFDYLTLKNGQEIYFQGIETLKFADDSLDLWVQPNDTHFGQQWNLHVADVESAWRFTQGSNGVLLASLDTGILTPIGDTGGIHDIPGSRLITDPSDDDNYGSDSRYYGHGHKAISVMSSAGNNGAGVAGINWNSDIYVNDVYSGVSLQQAIADTIAYARDHNLRVVFQGGIQGESWLRKGGTQDQLEQLIQDNADVALFAIAAGNYSNQTSVSGVAKLETTHDNVVSVGALSRTGTAVVQGLTNASAVNLAGYSNRGSNLTLVAATSSPAIDKFNELSVFGGTSAANPNLAGIASLVWSVNDDLDGGAVRQVLTDTAMDLGSTGRDNTFGHGLVNADAAVRRAWALNQDEDLANLYTGNSIFA